jgi:hypothetical protein
MQFQVRQPRILRHFHVPVRKRGLVWDPNKMFGCYAKAKHTLDNHSWSGISMQSMKGRMRKQGVKRVRSVRVHLLSFSSGVARLFGARGQ